MIRRTMIPLHSNITTSVLSRNAAQPTAGLSSIQGQVEGLTSSFLDQATDWKSLAAMMAGGLAYRLGKIGMMGLNVGAYGRTPLQVASIAFGLASEVTAFEFTNRVLRTMWATGRSPLQTQSSVTDHQSLNLWSWSGPQGWKQGWFSSLITFGTLKGFGRLAEGQNLFFQHAGQDLGMVLGHQLLYRAGIGERPEGTFSEQWVHAEATNLQIGAGMGLVYGLFPRLLAIEGNLNLSLESRGSVYSPKWKMNFQQPSLATESVGRATGKNRYSALEKNDQLPFILQMSSEKSGNGGESIGEDRFELNQLVHSAMKGEEDAFDKIEKLAEKEWGAFNVLSEWVLSGKSDLAVRARKSLAQVIMKDPQKYLNFILEIAKADPRNKPIVLKIFSEVASEDPGIILELDPLGSEKEKIKVPSPNLEILEILHSLSVEGWEKNVDQAIQKGDPLRLENLLEALYCLNIVQNSKAYYLLVQKFWEYPEVAEYLKLHMGVSSVQDILNHFNLIGSFSSEETSPKISDIPIDDLLPSAKKLVQETYHAKGEERDIIFKTLLNSAPRDDDAFLGILDLTQDEDHELSTTAWPYLEDLLTHSNDRKIKGLIQEELILLGLTPKAQGRFFEVLSKVVQTHPEYRWPVKLTQDLAHSPSTDTAKKSIDSLVKWASAQNSQAREALNHFNTHHGKNGREFYISAIQLIAMEIPDYWWPVEILCRAALSNETRDIAFKALEEGSLKNATILRGLKHLSFFEEQPEVQRRAIEILERLVEKNIPGAKSVLDEIRGGKK